MKDDTKFLVFLLVLGAVLTAGMVAFARYDLKARCVQTCAYSDMKCVEFCREFP